MTNLCNKQIKILKYFEKEWPSASLQISSWTTLNELEDITTNDAKVKVVLINIYSIMIKGKV